MENPIKHGMIWGAHPYFWKHPYILYTFVFHVFEDMSLTCIEAIEGILGFYETPSARNLVVAPVSDGLL